MNVPSYFKICSQCGNRCENENRTFFPTCGSPKCQKRAYLQQEQIKERMLVKAFIDKVLMK